MNEILFAFKCLYRQLPMDESGEKYGIYAVDYGIPQPMIFDLIEKREKGTPCVILILNNSQIETYGEKSLVDKTLQLLLKIDNEWTSLVFFETNNQREQRGADQENEVDYISQV